MSKFKIDKNVPVSPRSYGGPEIGERKRYPFEEMEIGDSFFCPLSQVAVHKVRAAAWAYSNKHPEYQFRILAVEENDQAGVRVWRVSKNES